MTGRGELEDLLRDLAPRVLGALVRRYGHFDTAEDAVQEALLAAATRWPAQGVPDEPRNWLITVAARRLTDLLRNEQARRQREEVVAHWALPRDRLAAPADRPPDGDDTVILLFLCCHPALSPTAQIALTLRAVGGLTTAEVARAFLTSEATMTRRISRAKATIRDSGIPFAVPAPEERAARLAAVRHVLYLIFTEGYAATSGAELHRAELSTAAIRLTRLLHRLLPEDAETAGLLALMLLTDARRPARTTPTGDLIPMHDQDRSRWRTKDIAEGIALITATLPRGPLGPYQLQAAIAALHDEAPDYASTDWPQITALYERLLTFSDNPVVALNHAASVAMSHGPEPALRLLDQISPRLPDDHRVDATRAHLLEMLGNFPQARTTYRTAAQKARSLPQQRYLNAQADRLE
ncbi:RNA polymerase sigma factor [Nocardia sp. NPDC004068]|uniref:RNA polymerase sigma factor n=1 Tax=Nocardia sp. NPDC004068 TaxID=3364303 RepID=UPI00368F0001